MEFFSRAKTVKLKSTHDKYLTADPDKETVFQGRDGGAGATNWSVELVDDADFVIRLKSFHGGYLTAADEQYLLGLTGSRVEQSIPEKLDSRIEWEPIREGDLVKMKTRYGNFLRANSGIPPWRNSITHDIPHRHHDWILWRVEIVELRLDSLGKMMRSGDGDDDDELASFSLRSSSSVSRQTSNKSMDEGRLIYYRVADEKGNMDDDDDDVVVVVDDDDGVEWASFHFKGQRLEELSAKLEEETGLEDIIVCMRNPLNRKISPLRLALPPNNSTMHIVVVPSSSKGAKKFLPESSFSPTD